MVILAAMLLCTSTIQQEVKAVDFKLAPPALAISATGLLTGAAGLPTDGPDDGLPTPPKRPRYRLATGFGHDVPLAFAVRQVVPPRVHVIFDRGVDRDVLVSWHGGQPWDKVIRTTVTTLGLHLTLSPGIVRISN